MLLLSGVACRSLQVDNPAPPPPLPEATARINLQLHIPLGSIANRINRELNQELMDEKDLSLGNGLVADVHLEKTGNLSLFATEQGKLQLGMPLTADGTLRLEKRIFGQRIATALPFEQALSPEIDFLPVLQKDWSFDIQDLEIRSFGKPLSLDVLGLQFDFEPLVKRQMVAIMENQLRSGALAALDFRRLAETFWDSFGKPRYIANGLSGNYVFPRPERLRMHQELTPDQELQLGIGLTAEMVSQKDRPLATELSPLPALTLGQVQGNDLEITLPISLSFDEIARQLNESLADSSIALNSKTRMRPGTISVGHLGERLLFSMDFVGLREGKKDLNGLFYLAGKPVFDAQKQRILFTNIEFKVKTKNMLTNTVNWSKRRKIRKNLEKRAIFPMQQYLKEAETLLAQFGEWQIPVARVRLQDPQIGISGIYPTRSDLVIHVRASGQLDAQFLD
ncbi:DUF4403 family protein [Cyclobacterium xiamenense]|uniref:DUF4403 family protein n=1 Tax=Cyclobacterium xiamenense TaxID=1297121 RepID=UPI0035D04A5D